MKLTAKNVSKLKYEEQLKLLNDIIAGGVEFDKINSDTKDHSFIQAITCAIVEALNELDRENTFGTEGWRHTILRKREPIKVYIVIHHMMEKSEILGVFYNIENAKNILERAEKRNFCVELEKHEVIE